MVLRPGRLPDDTVGMESPRRRHREQGATLLETCAALALASALSLALMAGLKPLACAVHVHAARETLTDALLEARRRAYATETTAVLKAKAGDGFVTTSWSGTPRPLGEGVTLASGPADGDVQFRASGLADNATLSLACSTSTASVVVNQRGVIR